MDAKWSLICEIMSTLRVLKRCVMKKIVINIYNMLQGECTELFMCVKHVQYEKYELWINLSNYTHVETASLNAGYFYLKLDSKCFCFM